MVCVEGNVKMDLKREWKSTHILHLVNDRVKWEALANTVMNIWVRENAGSSTRKGHISFSRNLSHGDT
jgi:hypothetical protein